MGRVSLGHFQSVVSWHHSYESEVVEECCSPHGSQEAARVTWDMPFSVMVTSVTCCIQLAGDCHSIVIHLFQQFINKSLY